MQELIEVSHISNSFGKAVDQYFNVKGMFSLVECGDQWEVAQLELEAGRLVISHISPVLRFRDQESALNYIEGQLQ